MFWSFRRGSHWFLKSVMESVMERFSSWSQCYLVTDVCSKARTQCSASGTKPVCTACSTDSGRSRRGGETRFRTLMSKCRQQVCSGALSVDLRKTRVSFSEGFWRQKLYFGGGGGEDDVTTS